MVVYRPSVSICMYCVMFMTLKPIGRGIISVCLTTVTPLPLTPPPPSSAEHTRAMAGMYSNAQQLHGRGDSSNTTPSFETPDAAQRRQALGVTSSSTHHNTDGNNRRANVVTPSRSPPPRSYADAHYGSSTPKTWLTPGAGDGGDRGSGSARRSTLGANAGGGGSGGRGVLRLTATPSSRDQRQQQQPRDERAGLRLMRVVGSQYNATVRVEAWVEKAEAKVKVRIDIPCVRRRFEAGGRGWVGECLQ